MIVGTIAALAVLAVALGDATTAAVVAAVGTVLNNLITIHNARKARELRKIITAPRQIVYDSEGHPVGTILKLQSQQDITLTRRREKDTDE